MHWKPKGCHVSKGKQEFFLEFFFYILTGLLAGFSAGLLGVGGGLVIVPALMLIFTFMDYPADHVAKIAIGSSLASITLSSISAAFFHFRAAWEEKELFKWFVPCIFLGSIFGVLIASLMPGYWLKIIFVFFIIAVGVYFLIQPDFESKYKAGAFDLITLFFSTGTISSMLGLGGGFLIIPFLSFFGYPIKKVIAISAIISLLIAFFGASTFFALEVLKPNGDFIDWKAALTCGISALLIAPLGAKLTHKVSPVVLRQIFGGWSIFMGIIVLLTI